MALELSARYKEILDQQNFQSLLSSGPWPHFILDNLIEPQTFKELQRRLLWSPKSYSTIEDHPAKLQLCYMEDLELARFFFSKKMRSLLEALAGTKLTPNQELAIQFRQMNEISPEFPPHVDLIDEPSLVVLYYVSPNWAPQNGDELVLLEDESAETHSATSKWVAPLENRLVAFLADKTHWHMVRRVQGWTRTLVLTEWLSIPSEGISDAIGI